jgi:hypothetical protein
MACGINCWPEANLIIRGYVIRFPPMKNVAIYFNHKFALTFHGQEWREGARCLLDVPGYRVDDCFFPRFKAAGVWRRGKISAIYCNYSW